MCRELTSMLFSVYKMYGEREFIANKPAMWLQNCENSTGCINHLTTNMNLFLAFPPPTARMMSLLVSSISSKRRRISSRNIDQNTHELVGF